MEKELLDVSKKDEKLREIIDDIAKEKPFMSVTASECDIYGTLDSYARISRKLWKARGRLGEMAT